MSDDDTKPFDPLDDDSLLSTDEIEALDGKKAEDDAEEPNRWKRYWQRVGHIYRTKVRTTTIILIVAFFSCVVLYGYTTAYYGVAPSPGGQQERPVQPERTAEEVVPSSTERPTVSEREDEESESVESPSSPSTSPTTTSTRGPLDFFRPEGQTGSPSESPDSDTGPTQSVPAR